MKNDRERSPDPAECARWGHLAPRQKSGARVTAFRAGSVNVGRGVVGGRPSPEVWDDPEIDSITAGDLTGEYATVRYGPPVDEMVVDLMPRPGDAFRYEDLEATTRVLDGVPVRIATPRMLYRMKRDTLRPDDRRDAERLLERPSRRLLQGSSNRGGASVPARRLAQVAGTGRALPLSGRSGPSTPPRSARMPASHYRNSRCSRT